ncbi:MAG TPA: alkaline phosphatase family protein [Streptosporangiaceae bacterium]
MAPLVISLALGVTQGRAQAAQVSLCGNPGPAPGGISHVIVVMLENLSYRQVVGSASAPYQTSLASQCGVGTAYFGATHWSGANYLAMSAGQFPASSTPGCGSIAACADSSDNLYSQLSAAGLSWAAFMEAMPSNCDPSAAGLYKLGHNPVVFYTRISQAACQANDIGVSDLTAQSGAFWNDLQGGTLPAFSWVTPDTADDGEGSGTASQNELAADNWLQKFIAIIAQSSAYQAGNTLVLVTYDEGTGADHTTGEDCTNQSLDLPVINGVSAHQDSCHVPLFVIYPYTPAGAQDPAFFDHYSITRTVEDIFGLPYLAHAADPQTASLVGHFGIAAASQNPAPAVNITQPGQYTTVSGPVTVTGTAAAQGSASIVQVQVGVDGGPLQAASGTANWSAVLDTTALSNGTHTINVQATDSNGLTGMANVTVTVSNLAQASSCPATPPGMTELSGNLSLESSQTGWTGTYTSASAVSRVEPAGGSYDGQWALQVAPKAGTSGKVGVNNVSPIWVPGPPGLASVAGQQYTGSAFVRANTAGEQISLVVRETTPTGTGVGSHTSTVTLADTGWHQISSAYAASASGDLIRYSLYASNLSGPAQSFLADCMSLQTP